MRTLAFAIIMVISSFANQADAVDCYQLDKRSNAYQTCMLRQENAARDERAQHEKAVREVAAERERENAEEAKVTAAKKAARKQKDLVDDIEIDNLLAMADVFESLSRKFQDCDSNVNEPIISKQAYSSLTMLVCDQTSLVIFTATRDTKFVQKLLEDLRNRTLQSVYIEDVNVLHDAIAYSLIETPRAVGVVFAVRNLQSDTFERILRQVPLTAYFLGMAKEEKIALKEPNAKQSSMPRERDVVAKERRSATVYRIRKTMAELPAITVARGNPTHDTIVAAFNELKGMFENKLTKEDLDYADDGRLNGSAGERIVLLTPSYGASYMNVGKNREGYEEILLKVMTNDYQDKILLDKIAVKK